MDAERKAERAAERLKKAKAHAAEKRRYADKLAARAGRDAPEAARAARAAERAAERLERAKARAAEERQRADELTEAAGESAPSGRRRAAPLVPPMRRPPNPSAALDDFIVLDIETGGPIEEKDAYLSGRLAKTLDGFRLLFAGTKQGSSCKVHPAEPQDLVRLREMLHWETKDRARLQEVLAAETEDLAWLRETLAAFDGHVVTYNGTTFDLPVLDRRMLDTLGERLEIRRHYDLMQKIEDHCRWRPKLDVVGRCTLGVGKSPWDHNENNRIWREEPLRLVDHNLEDLDLTHKLFMRVLRREPLFLGDAPNAMDGLPTTVTLPPPRA